MTLVPGHCKDVALSAVNLHIYSFTIRFSTGLFLRWDRAVPHQAGKTHTIGAKNERGDGCLPSAGKFFFFFPKWSGQGHGNGSRVDPGSNPSSEAGSAA